MNVAIIPVLKAAGYTLYERRPTSEQGKMPKYFIVHNETLYYKEFKRKASAEKELKTLTK